MARFISAVQILEVGAELQMLRLEGPNSATPLKVYEPYLDPLKYEK